MGKQAFVNAEMVNNGGNADTISSVIIIERNIAITNYQQYAHPWINNEFNNKEKNTLWEALIKMFAYVPPLQSRLWVLRAFIFQCNFINRRNNFFI